MFAHGQIVTLLLSGVFRKSQSRRIMRGESVGLLTCTFHLAISQQLQSTSRHTTGLSPQLNTRLCIRSKDVSYKER